MTIASSGKGNVSIMAPCSFEIATVWIRNAIRATYRFLAVSMFAGFRGTRFLKEIKEVL